MSLFEDTNPRPLKELLAQIHSRESALPDFQRDFVWEPNATLELIESIFNNYPAGSLLRIRNTHNLFACREFQGAPELQHSQATYLVLDGQQRLTSLYQAFYGVGDHRYYLNLRRLIDGDDLEECLFYVRARERRASTYADVEVQARELLLPMSVLKGGTGGFSQWVRSVARKQTDEAARTRLEDSLYDAEEQWIKTVEEYKFPVVTLSDETSAEAVCTIFETLNRTGVKLSPFELLTARFWPHNVNLRQLWAQAKTEYPIIEDFEIDPYYLLQIVSLASARAPSCKRGDVLNLKTDVIHEWWDRAASGLATGLKILRDDCGVIVPGWLPYHTIVLPLGGALAKHPLPSGPAAGAARHKLVRWFWCSVFGQAYESSPNSQAAKDVGELDEWMGGGAAPDTVTSFQFDPATLRDTTPRQRAVYRGTIALILSRGPRDFHNGAKLTGDLIIEHNVDDHHIFPQGYLDDLPEAQRVVSRLRDCVLNRTLIDRRTNIRIGKRAPSVYTREIEQQLNGTSFPALLASHLLPTDSGSPLTTDDFDAFLNWRQEAIAEEIRRVTESDTVTIPSALPLTVQTAVAPETANVIEEEPIQV